MSDQQQRIWRNTYPRIWRVRLYNAEPRNHDPSRFWLVFDFIAMCIMLGWSIALILLILGVRL
jgi:hypothetical protein